MNQSLDALVAEMINALSVSNGGAVQAGDLAVGLAWTEHVFGRGHDLLRLSGSAVTASSSTHDHASNIYAMQRPAYGLARHVINAAKSEASEAPDGFGRVSVYGAVGGWIAPYIAYCLAQDGFHAAVYWRPQAATPPGEAPATLVMAAGAIAGEVTPILIAPGEAYGAKQRQKMLVGQVPAQLIRGLQDAAGRESEISVLAVIVAPERMDAEFTDFVSIGDTLHSLDLGSKPPDLLDVGKLMGGGRQTGLNLGRACRARSSYDMGIIRDQPNEF